MVELPFITSAPGKVIIFGEHSVVYNKPAIALALSLRTYLLVTKNTDPNLVTLEFPDIKFQHSWKVEEFPWSLVDSTQRRPGPSDELIPEIIDFLSNSMLDDIESPLQYSAAQCFLYLYLHLCNKDVAGVKICVRSTLPIGAGLGSSATISVCLSAALAYLGSHISKATLSLTERHKEDQDCHFIDSWAFMGEKCIHGNPSGIDNACSSHGGAVMFQRSGDNSIPNVRTSMKNFPSLDLLLINTKIPRMTLNLVSGVSKLLQEYPSVTSSILTLMENVAKDLYSIMIKPFDGTSKSKLQELVRINQGLLSSLGVSHTSLDKIKLLTDRLDIGETKLTGAGGGGCAITLLNDDFDKNDLQSLIKDLNEEGYETFETKLGGKGCGILIPTPEQLPLCDFEAFANMESRAEIESRIGSEILTNWKFW